MFTGFWELLLVLLLLVFLFGAKQIPKLTKSMKEAIDTFKKESKPDEEAEEAKSDEEK